MADHGAVILFPYVGDSVGGSHRSSLLLVSALAATQDYQPLVAVHQSGPLVDELDRRQIDWVAAPSLGPLSGPSLGPLSGMQRVRQAVDVILATGRGREFLRSHKVGIVHTNDARMHRAWGWIAAREGVPQLWHQRNAGLSPIVRQVARRAGAIVAVSNFTRETLPRFLVEKTVVIDNPFVDPGWFTRRDEAAKQLRLRHEIGDHIPLVGFVGSFVARKRPEVFVEMAAYLQQSGVSARFLMYGAPGPSTDNVRQLISKHRLESVVVDAGYATPIEPILAGMDVMVAPAIREPFARTIVESMLVGTPTVASDEGGNLEIIEHAVNGVLAPSDDVMAFADATRALLADEASRSRLAAQARSTVTRRFSVERHAAAMAEVYDRLLPGVRS